jgi:hypothetical protein
LLALQPDQKKDFQLRAYQNNPNVVVEFRKSYPKIGKIFTYKSTYLLGNETDFNVLKGQIINDINTYSQQFTNELNNIQEQNNVSRALTQSLNSLR